MSDKFKPALVLQLGPTAIELLKKHEWSATWVGDSPKCCPECSQAEPGSYGIRPDQMGHTKDCAWADVLKRAGAG